MPRVEGFTVTQKITINGKVHESKVFIPKEKLVPKKSILKKLNAKIKFPSKEIRR
jgi:hypothetical protein